MEAICQIQNDRTLTPALSDRSAGHLQGWSCRRPGLIRRSGHCNGGIHDASNITTHPAHLRSGECGAWSAKEERACGDAPRTQWLSEDAIKAKGVALGYEVRQVKTEKRCYEVYAVDRSGAKVELYFNPVSGEIVSREEEN